MTMLARHFGFSPSPFEALISVEPLDSITTDKMFPKSKKKYITPTRGSPSKSEEYPSAISPSALDSASPDHAISADLKYPDKKFDQHARDQALLRSEVAALTVLVKTSVKGLFQ